jgi:hypothetical protein
MWLLQLHHGRGSLAMDIDGKWRAIAETLAGAGLVSVPFWSHIMDDVIKGGQVITAITGATIGLNGVYRLFFRKKRRKTDT